MIIIILFESMGIVFYFDLIIICLLKINTEDVIGTQVFFGISHATKWNWHTLTLVSDVLSKYDPKQPGLEARTNYVYVKLYAQNKKCRICACVAYNMKAILMHLQQYWHIVYTKQAQMRKTLYITEIFPRLLAWALNIEYMMS